MNYQEFLKFHEQFEKAEQKITVEKTGDSRLGGRAYADWTTYYKASYNGNIIDFDDTPFGVGDNRSGHDYDSQLIGAMKELNVISSDFPTWDYFDAADAIHYLINNLQHEKITDKIKANYISELDDLKSILENDDNYLISKILEKNNIKKDINTQLYDANIGDFCGYYAEDFIPLKYNELPLPKNINIENYKNGEIIEIDFDYNDKKLDFFPEKELHSGRHSHSPIIGLRIIPENSKHKPFDFCYQFCHYDVWNDPQAEEHRLRIYTVKQAEFIVNGEYDKLKESLENTQGDNGPYSFTPDISNEIKDYLEREQAYNNAINKRAEFSQNLYNKYIEKYTDNQSLINVLSPERINECLKTLAKNHISYDKMDVFIKDLYKMPENKKTDSWVINFDDPYRSNNATEYMFKKFTPHFGNSAYIPAYASEIAGFSKLLESYMETEYERITGVDLDQLREEDREQDGEEWDDEL